MSCDHTELEQTRDADHTCLACVFDRIADLQDKLAAAQARAGAAEGEADRLRESLAESVELLQTHVADAHDVDAIEIHAFLARYDESAVRDRCERVFVGIGPCVGVKGHGGKCDPVRLKR